MPSAWSHCCCGYRQEAACVQVPLTPLLWPRVGSSWEAVLFPSAGALGHGTDCWVFVSMRTMLVFANPFKLLSASACVWSRVCSQQSLQEEEVWGVVVGA